MTYVRKPIDLTTMNWNLNGTLNAKIIVALSLPENFLQIRPTQQFKGAVSRNSAKLGNYKMPVKLRET